MNKSELINAIVEKTAINKDQADTVFTAAVNAIMQAVAQGEKVTLTGFGSFSTQERSMRQCRNPQTGISMVVPAKTVPNFSAGKLFRRAVAPKSVMVVRKKPAAGQKQPSTEPNLPMDSASPVAPQPERKTPETTVKVLVSPKSKAPSQALVASLKKGLRSAFKFLG
jgi:DNA-binding protein HU-beta